MNNIKGIIFTAAGFLVFMSLAQADPVIIKAYKQVFSDAKPKCINCHVDALPKKAEGKHDWNAYGKTVKKAVNATGIADVPTSDDLDKIVSVLQKVGKVEDFKG